jgi:hypothetical protein
MLLLKKMASLRQMRKAVEELDMIHERATWFKQHLQFTFKKVMYYIASASLKKANSIRRDIRAIKKSGARDENEKSKITIKVNGRLAHTVKYLNLLLQYYESLCDDGYEYGQVTQPPDLDEKKRMKMLGVVDDPDIKAIIKGHFEQEYSEDEDDIIVPVRKRKSKKYA